MKNAITTFVCHDLSILGGRTVLSNGFAGVLPGGGEERPGAR